MNIRENIEITTEAIKEARKKYEPDTRQRYRSGIPSLEFVEAYGPAGFTKEELKQAKLAGYGSYYVNKEKRYDHKKFIK